jgi:hypothetical protein
VHEGGLVDDELVAADDVPHPDEVDRAEVGELVLGLEEGRREAPHVADHHRRAGAVARLDDLLGLAEVEAHRLLDQHVDVVLQRGHHGLGVVLVAVEHEHAVEPAGGEHLARVGVAASDAVPVADHLQERR